MGTARIQIYGLSDTGRCARHNEDNILWDIDGTWAVLADGMGGHLSGEVASRIASEGIAAELARLTTHIPSAIQDALRLAVENANRAIHAQAQSHPRFHQMGTTVVALKLHEGWLSCAHVGDSRLYRYHLQRLEQLSHDHSLVQELVDEGFLSQADAANSAHRNVITRALGLHPTVEVDLLQSPIHSGDLLLLCSDGLSDKLDEPTLTSYLQGEDLADIAQQLIDEANRRGGEDNISLILIRID